MSQAPKQSIPPPEVPDVPLAGPELVVVHLCVVLDHAKGWRVTARIQDGWQGVTLEHWSRGGSAVQYAGTKASDDLQVAIKSALEYLPAF